MKRSGAEQLLLIWSGCGGRLNGVAVATAKCRCRVAVETRPAMLGQGAASQAELSAAELPPPFYLHWTQHRLQCSSSARLWAAACVPGDIWPFGGRNALRRPKKVKKAMEAQYNQDKSIINAVLLLCDFRSCE